MHYEIPETTRQLLGTIRDRRSAKRPACPHCAATHIVRWGHFSGRQRYRCCKCRRSFSDLTGTCFSYIKKLDRWPEYFMCLTDSRTVREAARVTGVSVTTAFRWRHLILRGSYSLRRSRLKGLVEFAVTSLPYSRKGQGRAVRSSWQPTMFFGAEPLLCQPGCIIVLGSDRAGGHHAARFDTAVLTGAQLRHIYDPILSANATLLCGSGRYGKFASLLTDNERGRRQLIKVSPFAPDDFTPHHNRNAHKWLRGFRSWLIRFRGVATRYVPSYLEWRRIVDDTAIGPWLKGLTPCGTGPPVPTTPANSRRRRADRMSSATASPGAGGPRASPTLSRSAGTR